MLTAGVVLIAIELIRSVPAWRRVRTTRRCDGVSPISVGVLAGTSVAWIAVAVLADSPAAAIATGVWTIFHFLLLREVVRVKPATTRPIAISTVLSLAAMIVVAVIGIAAGSLVTALGIAIGIAAAGYSVPALVAGMTSKSTAGLSLIALSTNSLEGAIYFVGGIGLGGIAPSGTHVIGYTFFGAVALLSNVPRLVRTLIRRATGKDKQPAPQADLHRLEGF